MSDLIVRFLFGGLIVSLFAISGDLFRPKSFAGIFGAAPSVALASLILTVAKHGHEYSAVEARSMLLGAFAFLVYARAVAWLIVRRPLPAMKTTLLLLPAWLGVALGGWWLFLR